MLLHLLLVLSLPSPPQPLRNNSRLLCRHCLQVLPLPPPLPPLPPPRPPPVPLPLPLPPLPLPPLRLPPLPLPAATARTVTPMLLGDGAKGSPLSRHVRIVVFNKLKLSPDRQMLLVGSPHIQGVWGIPRCS